MLYAWGSGNNGQLGVATSEKDSEDDSWLPLPVSFCQSGVRRVAAGSSHSLAISNDNELFAWGSGESGQLGLLNNRNEHNPKCVDTLCGRKIEQLAAGWDHSMVLSENGEVFCWGSSKYSQIGLLESKEENPPHVQCVPKPLFHQLGEVALIACGMRHSAIVTRQGELFTFGYGRFGELGHGDTNTCPAPKRVDSLTSRQVVLVACGWKHTICSSAEGEVFAWGSNTYGQLGIPPPPTERTRPDVESPARDIASPPVVTASEKEPREPNVRRKKRIIVSARGKAKTDVCLETKPVEALSDKQIRSLACGWTFTLAVTEEGIFTFGRNNYGQLGRGDIGASHCHIPTVVSFPPLRGDKVRSVACGSEYVLAANDEGQLFSWGWNEHGNLGLGDTKDRNTPSLVEALGDVQVALVAAGGAHSLAVGNPHTKGD